MSLSFLLSLSISASLADSLFNSGFYEPARIEYAREFYFYPELRDRRAKRLNYALCLHHEGNALSYFELQRFTIDFTPLNKDEIKILANKYIDLGDSYRAQELLSATEEYRLLAYTHILQHQWTKARHILRQNDDSVLTDIIDRYLELKPKNANTAMFFSAFCPGLGETYAGDPKTGIKAFLVNTGSVLLLYNAINKKKYVDAGLIFNFLFQRFYFGSIFNAKRLVLEHNENLESKYISEFAEQIHFKH